MIYPVNEDRHPPSDPGTMAHYLVRYGLLPELDWHEISTGLINSQACIEPVNLDQPPALAPVEPVRVPAQWEPMRGVILNWPVLYPPLWPLHAQMAEAIAAVAEVVITVPAAMWAHAAWLYLKTRRCCTLDRVRFLLLPTNDIWVRDYGPIIGRDANGQTVAVKTIYNHLDHYPQEWDDVMALRWALHAGIPVYPTHLHTEGGNLWTDGAGTLIMTEQLLIENPGYDRRTIQAYLQQKFIFDKLILVPRMPIERTGHVDLLVKLADAQTALVSAPTERTSSEALKAAGDILRRETNAAGEPYEVVELPTPPLYFNWFTYPIRRSYTNALTVNGRVLVPVYGLRSDDTALRIYESAMPDHDIIPIDCKIGANGGGAVHCMTKEIPGS